MPATIPSVVIIMSARKTRSDEYGMYRTHLWGVYDDYNVTDEQRIESILRGLERVEKFLLEDLEAEQATVQLIEWPENGTFAWQLPQKANNNIWKTAIQSV